MEAVDEIETSNNPISRRNLVTLALELCHILKYEFILAPVSLTFQISLKANSLTFATLSFLSSSLASQ